MNRSVSTATAAAPAREGPSSPPPRLWPILFSVITIAASAAVSILLVWSNGSIAAASLLIGLPIALVLLVLRLELGIYVLLAAAMLLEQFQIFGISTPITARHPFYNNLNSLPAIGNLGIVAGSSLESIFFAVLTGWTLLNPVELILIAMIVAWALRAASTRQWHFRPIPHLEIAVSFLAVLLFYTLYGLARGGDLKAALWEIRALYYLCGVFFLATQLIRTERQIRICVWIIIVGVGIKGLQGCGRFFIELGGSLQGVPAITSHEDALFMSTAFTLMASLLVLGCRRRKEFIALACFFPPAFLTFILTQRRVAYGVFVFSLLIVFVLLPKDRRRLALKLALPLIPLILLYTAVFWNSTSTAALPIQQVKSIFAEGEQEDTSNTYRKIENFNMEQTIRQKPLGIGFGKRYLVVMPLPVVDFPLWDYIPHNCIYWIWAKTGFFGFVVFWLFFGTYTVQTIHDYRREPDPFYRAVCLMVATFILGQLVVAYYDLQITFYRNMIYLGVAMALPIAIRNRPQAPESEASGEKSHAR